jgi:rhodanese-related sulfurtransferase
MFKLFERGFKDAESMREAASEIKAAPTFKVIDVRTLEEHRQGHIPGSLLVPLDQWEKDRNGRPRQGARRCLSIA